MNIRQSMPKIINVGGIEIEYQKKNVKNINMRVRPDGTVSVSAPYRVAERDVIRFIREKEEWILARLATKKAIADKPVRHWVSGENLYVFGRKYRLIVTVEQQKRGYEMELRRSEAVFRVPSLSTAIQREKFVRKWYKDVLDAELARMVPFWEERTGLYSSGYRIRDMKSRWGSCNCATNELCFNLQLALYDRALLEYVVMHELAHTEVPNHSGEFWDLVEEYMPDWKERRKAMRHLTPEYLPAGTNPASI